MKAATPYIGATLGLLAVLVVTPSSAEHPAASSNLGAPVHSPGFDRQVQIGPKTKWANVTRNETVKFVVTKADGTQASFIWRFDTLGTPLIDLNAIAPAGARLDRPLTVYVGTDPRDVGG